MKEREREELCWMKSHVSCCLCVNGKSEARFLLLTYCNFELYAKFPNPFSLEIGFDNVFPFNSFSTKTVETAELDKLDC